MAAAHGSYTWFQAQTKVLKQVFIKSKPKAPPLYDTFFNSEAPDMRRSFLQVMPIVGFGAMKLKPEGSAPFMDQAYEGWASMFPFLTFGLQYAITMEGALEDAMNLNAKLPAALRFSEEQTKEFLYWNVVNQAFNTSVPLFDGLPLCSTTHPLGGTNVARYGTYSNSLGVTSLTPESLQQMFVLMETLPDDRALNIYRTPKKLLVPPGLHRVAEEILTSVKYPYSDENRRNVVQDSVELQVIRYITAPATGPFPWFVTAGKGGFGDDAHTLFTSHKFQNRTREWHDDASGNTYQKSEFRSTWGSVFGAGFNGSQGA